MFQCFLKNFFHVSEPFSGSVSSVIDFLFLSNLYKYNPIIILIKQFLFIHFLTFKIVVFVWVWGLKFNSLFSSLSAREIVDLNNDQIINILDVSAVAVEFGKTV